MHHIALIFGGAFSGDIHCGHGLLFAIHMQFQRQFHHLAVATIAQPYGERHLLAGTKHRRQEPAAVNRHIADTLCWLVDEVGCPASGIRKIYKIKIILLIIRNIIMINIAIGTFGTSTFFKRNNLLPSSAVGRDVPTVEFLQRLLFGEFHPLPRSEIVVIEDKLVGIVEVTDNLASVFDAVVKEGSFGGAALHGEGVVEVDGDEVATFLIGEVGTGEGGDEGDDGEAPQQQYDEVLHPRLAFGFLRHILQHLHIREIVSFISSEIEKMYQNGYQDGGVADKK